MIKLTPMLGAAVLIAASASMVRAQDESSDMDCGTCHDEIAAAFALTPHAQDRDDSPGCQSCHGDGTRHMEEGDAALITIPSGAGGAPVCATCHGEIHSAFQASPMHGRAAVHCDSCHRIHPAGPPRQALLVEDPAALCATCHPRQIRSFSRPYGHRLGRGGLDCVSCHDPHGGPRADSLRVDRSGDTVCVSCHADLRGPFVFPHVAGLSGGCESCHEAHGSSNPHALRRTRVDQLCLECHSPVTTTLGSQPPATHDLLGPRYRNCTTCHVAVHGSNTSPTLRK